MNSDEVNWLLQTIEDPITSNTEFDKRHKTKGDSKMTLHVSHYTRSPITCLLIACFLLCAGNASAQSAEKEPLAIAELAGAGS